MIILRLIGESFGFAIDAIRQNKLRTMLSLLGITIGIFTIISVFSAVDTLKSKLQSSVDKLGSNTLFVEKWPWIFEGGNYPWWKFVNRPVNNLREYKDLKERSQYAEAVSYEVSSGSRTVKYKNSSVEGANLNAASQEFNKTWNLDFQEGRYFTESEGQYGSPVVILGAEVARGLFGDQPAAGKQVQVMGRRLTVVGVFKKEGEDPLGMSQDNNFLIPLNYAKSLFDVENEKYNPSIKVRGKENISQEEVESELRGVMRSIRKIRPGKEDNFSINKTTMLSNQLDLMFGAINVAGGVIGVFSVLVGGFGIANIMFVSVKERTNIIGIQKSLGAKNYFILLQFIFEAVLLCMMGGALGLLLVYLGTLVSTYAFDLEMVLYAKNIIRGVSISVFIGVISGFWPAYKASRLDPVEAIRS
jgi:putative ABC transport system permease protein